jgi:hypothetical protein
MHRLKSRGSAMLRESAFSLGGFGFGCLPAAAATFLFLLV